MANRLGASVQVVRQRRIEGPPERIVAEILVRKVPEDQQAIGNLGGNLMLVVLQADQDILSLVSMFRNNLQMFLDYLIFALYYLSSKAKF